MCESSEDCCLGKCYQEEDHFGVILTSEKKCLDNTCQESGQVATGAPCTQASDCCGHEKVEFKASLQMIMCPHRELMFVQLDTAVAQ